MNTITPRIYVASLSDYNAGKLHGVWIDVSLGAEHVWAEIKRMLAESKELIAEEWAIHDYEGFAGLSVSEGESIDCLCEFVELLEEHGQLIGGLVEYFGGLSEGIEQARQAMQSTYCGAFSSVVDFAEHFVADGYSASLELIPNFIRSNIDYEGVARDMELGGDIFTIEVEGEVHVFWSN